MNSTSIGPLVSHLLTDLSQSPATNEYAAKYEGFCKHLKGLIRPLKGPYKALEMAL